VAAIANGTLDGKGLMFIAEDFIDPESRHKRMLNRVTERVKSRVSGVFSRRNGKGETADRIPDWIIQLGEKRGVKPRGRK